MTSSTTLAGILIGTAILMSGCDRNEDSPISMDKEAAPPPPIIVPERGDSTEKNAASSSSGNTGSRAELPAAVDTTVADIVSRPELYVGKPVSVVSRVDEIFTPWSFKLDERQLGAGGIDNDLLVVGAMPATNWTFDNSWKDKEVVVVGTVRILQAEDFRREYGRGVDDLLFRRFEGKPAVVAHSIRPAG